MQSSRRIFGLDTEYGLWVEGRGPEALLEESRQVVRAYPGHYAGPWDYDSEDPRRDMRGFRVEHLNYDPRDAQYDKPGRARLSNEEERSDRALPNGARFYNDHGHPEYATPECCRLRDLVAHDKAGERLVWEAAQARSAASGARVEIFKNNTDFHGASYGAHEGYLCARDLPFERLFHGLLPLLITRQIYAGAGKVGRETDGPLDEECVYQLSQRADFFNVEASVDTLYQRPIFNTRDEAHADPRRYRRLHVICGDANMSEFATALKMGVVLLTLELLESGWEPLIRLRRPVEAIKRLSRDPSRQWLVELEDGGAMRATDIQRVYLQEATRQLLGRDDDTDWTLAEWERVLDDLDSDPTRLEDRVDWAAKRRLLETYMEAADEADDRDVGWAEATLQSLDLAYHNLDPEAGLYRALEEAGAVVQLTEEADIRQAMDNPPPNTRASVRGALVRRFGEQIERISWGRVRLQTAAGSRWISLHGCQDGQIAELTGHVEQAATVETLLQHLQGAS